jgi:hypothetical protein
MQDGRLPRGGPGRAPNDGNFVLTELEVIARPNKDLKYWKTIHNSKWESTAIPASWKVMLVLLLWMAINLQCFVKKNRRVCADE